jgi:WD40 repeat protein
MLLRRIFLTLSSLLLLAPSLFSQQTAEELRAEIALKKLTGRFDDEKADRDKLRQDILTFRRTYLGLPHVIRAADMLRQLPSPADRLDPRRIKPLEVFDWQPKELVAILGEHRGRQGGPVSCVAYSPDRKLIASGGAHLVRLWDTDPKRLLRQIVLLSAVNATCLAFSPDSKTLAVGSSGAIFLFDVDGKDTKLRLTIPAGSTWINAIAFDPKGKPLLACTSYDTKVRLFDLEKKDPKEMEIAVLAKHQQSVTCLAFSPEGAHLASGSTDGTIRLWKIDGAKSDEEAKIDAIAKGVHALAYSKDGRLLAAGGADGSIALWTTTGAKATVRGTVAAHGSTVSALAFAPSGNTITSGGADGLIQQWDVAKKAPTRTAELKGHQGAISSIGYSSDGANLVSGSADCTVRVWDNVTRRERVPPDGPLSRIAALAFHPEGAVLANAGDDHFLRLWSVNAEAPKERHALKGDDYPIYSLAYTPDGKLLATGGYLGTVRFWGAATATAAPQSVGQIKDLPGYIYSLAFSPDAARLLVRHYRTASLFDMKTRSRLHGFEADEKGTGINDIVFSPDGSRVAAASGYYLMKNNEFVKNKDGSYVYFDPSIRVWETEVGKLLHKHALAFPVGSVVFTPDGSRLVGSDWSSVVRHWDLPEPGPKETENWKPEVSYFYRMQYSPDGRMLLTHGQDNRIIIWDASTKKKLHQWSLPEYVGTEAWCSDSRHVAVSLYTGVTYILRLDSISTSARK